MLTQDQLGFFARNGYLLIPRALDDGVCDELISMTQEKFPDHWDPHDVETWTGEVTDSCHSGQLREFKGLLKFQHKDLVEHPTIAQNLGFGSTAWTVAEALIGSDLADLRVRGLYPIVPLQEGAATAPFKPHVEGHPVEVIGFGYLVDVPEDGGALLIWPGSHRDIYPAMESEARLGPCRELSIDLPEMDCARAYCRRRKEGRRSSDPSPPSACAEY